MLIVNEKIEFKFICHSKFGEDIRMKQQIVILDDELFIINKLRNE